MAAKSDVVVKLILVFFISLLSFSIGTFVGKKYSDNQHRLANLEPAHGSRSVASAKEEGHGDGQAVSDEEIAKLAAEFAADDSKHSEAATHGEAATHSEAAGHAAASPHAEPAKQAAHGAPHGAPVAQTVKPSETANALAQGQGVPEVKKAPQAHKERIPSSLPQDVAQYSAGKFTVQIASFPTETEAKKRAEELKTKGFGAFYFPATIKGKSWYRVGVGLFPNEAEAVTYKKEFAEKTKMTDTVIQKIAQ